MTHLELEFIASIVVYLNQSTQHKHGCQTHRAISWVGSMRDKDL